MVERFDEHSLRDAIVDKWGPAGAHVEVFDAMAKRIAELERERDDLVKHIIRVERELDDTYHESRRYEREAAKARAEERDAILARLVDMGLGHIATVIRAERRGQEGSNGS